MRPVRATTPLKGTSADGSSHATWEHELAHWLDATWEASLGFSQLEPLETGTPPTPAAACSV